MINNPNGFKGSTIVHMIDGRRLTAQLRLIYELMLDGQWRTPEDVSALTKLPNTRSVEAQFRNLRKHEFGGWDNRFCPDGHFVLRRNRNDVRGYSEYRLLLSRTLQRPGAQASLLDAYDQEVEKAKQKASENAKDGQGEAFPPRRVQSDLFR